MRAYSFLPLAAFCLVALTFSQRGDAVPITIDASDREAVVAGFHQYYLGTEDFADHVGWTGSLSACNPGTLSAEFHSDVETRINYFRAMAGVVADIELDPALNAASQEAALMMARNRNLSHTPPSTWQCYTAAGYDAAFNGNLSLGFNGANYGPEAVVSQMRDAGAGNTEVGHRRWLIYSRAPQYFGNGSIPPTPDPSDPATLISSSVFWVIGTNRIPAVAPSRIAWPPAGFVPSPVVFPRWSFGLPDQGANFSTASVTMTDSTGGSISLGIISRSNPAAIIGDPTIVWEPQIDLSALGGDATFTVNVTGITGVPTTSASYQVTIIDPYVATPLALSGSATPYLNHDNVYSFNPIAGADSYEFRHAQVAAGSWVEGGENATPAIDATSADMALRSTALYRSGSYSLHLGVNGTNQDQHFELGRDIIPTATSTLAFYHRFRYVGDGTRLVVEILPAGGSWTQLWSRSGQCSASCGQSNWDRDWIYVGQSLSAYAGQIVSLRFRYVFESGYQWWPLGDSPDLYGAYIDDISVSNSQQLENQVTVPVAPGATTITFNTSTAGDYLLQLRPVIGGSTFAYGDPLAVYASGIAPEPSVLPTISAVSLDAAGAYCITTSLIDPATARTMQVQSSPDMTAGSWASIDFTVNDNPGGQSSTICITPAAGLAGQYFRIVLPDA